MSLFTRCFELDAVGKVWDILFVNEMNQEIIQELCFRIIVGFKAKCNLLFTVGLNS